MRIAGKSAAFSKALGGTLHASLKAAPGKFEAERFASKAQK